MKILRMPTSSSARLCRLGSVESVDYGSLMFETSSSDDSAYFRRVFSIVRWLFEAYPFRNSSAVQKLLKQKSHGLSLALIWCASVTWLSNVSPHSPHRNLSAQDKEKV